MERLGYTAPLGISARNRAQLATLHARQPGPFRASDAAAVLGLGIQRVRRLLSYLCQRGWLVRIRRGLYATVPLDTRDPAEWREEPWLVASREFGPCYISGWSACEHWHLTDQIFRAIVVVSIRKLRSREVVIQHTKFLLRVRSPEKLFGTSRVWLHGASVDVADPSRTILDILDDPKIGGGIRHVAEVVAEYFESRHRDDARLLRYIERLGNRSVHKRLGYLLEALSIDAPELLQSCFELKSKGLSRLDPGVSANGRILRRWNLRVNVPINGATNDHAN